VRGNAEVLDGMAFVRVEEIARADALVRSSERE
jgi:hypothetical protein